MANLSEQQNLPVENALSPDSLRRVLWEPPAGVSGAELEAAVRAELTRLGARPWQIDLTIDLVVTSIEDSGPPAG